MFGHVKVHIINIPLEWDVCLSFSKPWKTDVIPHWLGRYINSQEDNPEPADASDFYLDSCLYGVGHISRYYLRNWLSCWVSCMHSIPARKHIYAGLFLEWVHELDETRVA
jgi:hypothetical protein